MASAEIMTSRLDAILRVERLSATAFTGSAESDPADARVFGGQIVAQALLAAYDTVTDRRIHALHGHFLSPGLPQGRIGYHVDETRTGRSFAVRRVEAEQDGRLLFIMSASFHAQEDGLEHQDRSTVPPVPADGTGTAVRQWSGASIWEVEDGAGSRAQRRFWVRMPDDLRDDPAVADAAVAYASDMRMGSTPLRGHAQRWNAARNASLDHSIWFHRPADVRSWNFLELRSPISRGGRGLTHGLMLDRHGRMMASMSQESLIRR